MIKVAVIGYGYWGPNLVRNCLHHPKIDLVAVCDMNAQRLKLLAKQCPHLHLTTDANDIFKSDVDAVLIATPVETHERLTRLALEAGKHVWVEKPFTTSVKKAEQMMALARRKKSVLLIDHVFVYTPAVRLMKELCVKKALGNIIYCDATRTNLGLFQRDVNVIWDLATHDVAIMQFLLNETPKYVSATGLSYFKDDKESIAYLTAHYDSHKIAHGHFSWLSPVKVRTMLLGGDKKMVIYDDTQPSEKVKIYDKGVSSIAARQELFVSYRSGDVIAPRLETTEGLKYVCDDFVDSIEKSKEPVSSAEFSLKVISVLEAASKSLKGHGKKVRVM